MTETVTNNKWITKTKIDGKDCLRFQFSGILSQEQSIEACTEWKEISSLDKEKKYIIIFNATDLTDYEPLSRREFQKTIKELKNQIDKLWVVTDSKLISGGATIMGMFTSFSIKSVSAEEQIKAS